MKNRYSDIILTGPESSGKTTLTKALSHHFGWPYVAEFARTYLTHLNRKYDFEDVQLMAQGQQQAALAARTPGLPLIHDTDLLTYLIWSEDKFHRLDASLQPDWHQVDTARPLYLLCRPNLAWEPDPLREDPHRLPYLFDRHIHHLERLQLPYIIIDELGDARIQQAIQAVVAISNIP